MKFSLPLSVRLMLSRRAAARFHKLQSRQPKISFADLSEDPPEDLLPYLDRNTIDESALTADQLAWRRDGVLYLPQFIPDAVTDPYIARREQLPRPAGWLMATPYMHVPELRNLALYPPLMEKMKSLIGEEMLLHLALTGWRSSEREWHQDDYLNPPFVNCWYAAVWIALGDIGPESGPFEYVPGSHRWPLLRREKIQSFLTERELNRKPGGSGFTWEAIAQRFMTPAIEAEIIARRGQIVRFIAKKGDLLIWHGRLVHCGAKPRHKQLFRMERRSLITHYSGINHRPDMEVIERDHNGQSYAVFNQPLK
jgi:hypothetical protein